MRRMLASSRSRSAVSPAPACRHPTACTCAGCRGKQQNNDHEHRAASGFDFGSLAILPPVGRGRHSAGLTIGTAGDRFEQEADRVADAVVGNRPVPPTSRAPGQQVQRSSEGAAHGAEAPSLVHDVLGAPGERLDPATRAFLEPRFGFDLSRVRVHDDDRAARSARQVGARAYTVGSDVVFGAGEYRAQTAGGRRLLAHELAHVGQQGPGAPTVLRRATDDAPLDVGEEEEEAPGTEEEDDAADGDTPTSREARQEEPEAAPDLDESADAVETQSGGKKPPKKAPAADLTITQIDVSLTDQNLVITWSDGSTSKPITVSTGKGLPNTTDDPCKDPTVNGSNCTPPGTYTIGFLGGADYKNQHGDKMAWYAEFLANRDIGIHDSQPVTGKPASHGCVRIDMASSKLINKHVVKGKTKVVLSGKAPTKPWKKAAKAKAKAKGKGK